MSKATKHVHHIIPKHVGGSDEPSNMIELSVEEHAKAHQLLFETFGRWEDYVAWKGLEGCGPFHSSKISKAIMSMPKAQRIKMARAGGKGNIGVKKSEIGRMNIAKGKLGDKNPMKVEKHRLKMQQTIKNLPNVTCPHCGKNGHQQPMRRWHFNNCKNK